MEELKNRGPNEQGNYSDVYALIYSWIKDAPDVGGYIKLWLQGATQANNGSVYFSILIHE